MEKHQYVLWGTRQTDRSAFFERLRDTAVPRLEALGPRTLKLTLAEPVPPRLSVIPFARFPAAVVSLWGDPPPDPAAVADILAPVGDRLGGYRVEASEPRSYERTWPDRTPTPGVGLLTLLRRKSGLDDAEFVRRWHQVHSPHALRMHPFWCYLRNVVRAPLLPDSPPLDGIVEEHFRTREDLLQPHRFFGGPLRMLPNMIATLVETRAFLDLRRLESFLVTELHVRS